ncbi:glucose dehydrogenase [Rhexocercosporidium sp. MPI-PUGE-AT-0058]|nr:glucose dehydrogenase [Rhexocercosporidium sp. MPI-PUGE-AT-0058]
MNCHGFDYIIVGGGVAGCVLVSRLSSSLPDKSILLIEAGPENADDRVAPSIGVLLSDTTDIQWNHKSVQQKELDNKVIDQTQGKDLGGSSAINYQAWTRGSASEFDQWAYEVGDERWSWNGLVPYFKRSETFIPGKDMSQEKSEAHGYSGPIKVSHVSSSGGNRNYPLKSMIADIHEAAGLKRNYDMNSGETIGYSEFSNATFNGKRQWAALYPRGDNVSLWSSSQATKLFFSGMKVVGVEVLRGSSSTTARAQEEVIVSSGAQNTPKLLLLSGIGLQAELEQHGIQQIADLPVGENFSDHPFLCTFWKLRDRGLALGDMEMTTPECDWTAGSGCDWFAFHRHEDESVKKLAKKTLGAKEFERFQLVGRPHTESFAIILRLIREYPRSARIARFDSSCLSSPTHAPLVDPRFFTNPIDLKLIYECTRTNITAIKNSFAVSKYGAVEYGIAEADRDDLSDAALRRRLAQTCATVFHGSGTCAMGTVVDTECRVLGFQGLRVVDASIFPFPLASHYQAAVYAVAEQISDIIARGVAL